MTTTNHEAPGEDPSRNVGREVSHEVSHEAVHEPLHEPLHESLHESLHELTVGVTVELRSEFEGGAGEHELDHQELALNDVHSEVLGSAEFEDSVAHPVTASEPLSLPAALCDDKLLEEINSIPDKMGFKIGDVADMLGIKQYVLRYWETEFDLLKPKKASNNQRMYTRKDVENAFLIRKLLHRDRFSIEGARNALKELKAHVKKEKDYSQVVHRLESIHDRIEDLVLDIRRTRQLFR